MRKLIFIHGAGNEKGVWNSVLDYLSKQYETCALNLPGHGTESGICNSIDEYSKWVLDYIAEKNWKNIILVGHSMGGAITLKAAKSDRVAALVIVDSGLKLPVSPKILNGLKNNARKTIETIAKWSFSRTAPEDLVKKAVNMMLSNKNTILRDFEACSMYTGYKDAEELNIPSLVVVGEHDVMTPLNLAEETASYLKAEVRIIGGSGHMVQVEKPKILAEELYNFISMIRK